MKCVLAIDLGTGGPKVSVVNQNGEILATRSGHFETIYSHNGIGVEQDAEGWWKQVLQLSKEVIDESNTANNIVAIGNCAQYFSSIPVNENGDAVHNSIMWEDSRASRHIKKKMGGFPSVKGYNFFKLIKWMHIVGIPPVLMGVDVGSHMLLMKNEMPEAWKKTYKVLEPSDFLSLKLTGKFQTNENTGFPYTLIQKAAWSKGKFNTGLVKSLGLDMKHFPEIMEVGANLGKPTKAVIEFLGISENVSVFSGINDITACSLGGGAFNDNDTVLEIGTTLNTSIVIDKRKFDIMNGLFSVSSPIKDKYIMVGEPGAGAKALNYLLYNFLCVDDNLSKINTESNEHHAKIADDMAAVAPIGSNGLVFMPWIFGATFPELDTKMRGGFLNLNTSNNRNDMIRAVFESYAISFKWMLEIKQKSLNIKINSVNFTGGGALWETAAQICADALQVPVQVIDEPRQANTKGIAYMCFNNLGIVSYDEMKSKLKIKKVYLPNSNNFKFYDNRLVFYKKLYKSMRPIYSKLNHL